MKEAFKASTKDDTLQPYISKKDFRSSIYCNLSGYSLYVFDVRHQKIFESAQSIKVEAIFFKNLAVGIYGYVLVLTNKFVSISSDSQRNFDLT